MDDRYLVGPAARRGRRMGDERLLRRRAQRLARARRGDGGVDRRRRAGARPLGDLHRALRRARPRRGGAARALPSRVRDTLSRQRGCRRFAMLILSSDSHVFEPPDLWTTRIDAAFRDRAPRMQRIDGVDQLVVERDQVLSGIGLISNAGARFEAPETISAQARFEDVHRGGYDPEQHLADMRARRRGGRGAVPVAGPVLLQGGGLRADVGHLPRLQRLARRVLPHRSRPAQGHRDDQPGRRPGRRSASCERAARLGFAGAMISEYPLEDRRYDQPEYEPFWAAAAGPRHAAQPAHGDAAAGQDPRRRGRGRSATPAAGRPRPSARRCRCAT